MKLLKLLTLAASVWLAGCAVPGSPTSPGAGGTDAGAAQTTQAGRSALPAAGDMPPLSASTELRSANVTSLDAPANIWERIRSGFSMPDLDTDLVRDREQFYAQRPEYMFRMTERSRMYLFHIVEELELRGMPSELALLPFIESAFNPQAVSSAKAAGMWQFMPATGRHFDLKQNIFRDDRRSVLDSTRAALDYLQKLHKMFGDWHLALAAYNWGEGSVGRAIKKNQAAGLPTGYTDLQMPNETRYYVPKLQAVKNIIAHPERFNVSLPEIGNHPFFDTVDITRDIDVAVAARLAEVSVDDFRALNPSQRKPVIFATGTPQILLPWENAVEFKKNLAATDAGKLASWTAWVAPSTMPSREAARRVGMSETDFRSANGIPTGMLVKAGSTLLVPRGENAAPAVASQVVDNAQIGYTPEIILKRFSVPVRKGDTIARVAARYDLPAATVAGWNKTSVGAKLKRGQSVVVFLPVRAGSSAAVAGVSYAKSVERRAQARDDDEDDKPAARRGKRDAKADKAGKNAGGKAKRGRDDDEDDKPAAKGKKNAAKGKPSRRDEEREERSTAKGKGKAGAQKDKAEKAPAKDSKNSKDSKDSAAKGKSKDKDRKEARR